MGKFKRLFMIIMLCFMVTGCAVKADNPAASYGKAPYKKVNAAEISPSAEIDRQEKEYSPTKQNVKLLGRTSYIGKTLWLSYSASGIEFTFTGTKADITLIGDNIAANTLNEGHYCRIGIYVNDKLVSDLLLSQHRETITAFKSDTMKTVTIKVLKLSEVSESTMGISSIGVISSGRIHPAKARAHRIEFIGDSITCGFGVDDSYVYDTFSTETEDATKTYAYKTAQALKADYSIVSISGYGILSGHTDNGMIDRARTIPTYYETMGFSHGLFNSKVIVDTVKWNFSNFTPELIVINLGTNDYSYCRNDKKKRAEFTARYTAFLKQVRNDNPNSAILCTLGMMGNALYPCVKNAVAEYMDETGDKNVFTMKYEVELASDGFAACWHPSEITHNKAAVKLTAEIRSIMGW